jgi:hypothetical protein
MVRRYSCALLFLATALGLARGQVENSTQSQEPQLNPTAISVFGPKNPPVSGFDDAAMGPTAEPRSFLIPGLHFSQSLDSNVNQSTQNSGLHTVTRALGSVQLQRLWKRYETDLDYVGGGAFYSNRARDTAQLHELTVEQKLKWQRGQLSLGDSFSYLPEGSFGAGSFGGAAGGGMEGGGGHFGSLGRAQHLTNEAVLGVSELLTPRSAVTLSGNYTTVHFLDSSQGLIDSRQISGEAGYSYQLNRTDQIGAAYEYQNFHFPRVDSSAFKTNLVEAVYAHRISERMDLSVSGGPQITLIDNPQGNLDRVSFSGRAMVHYSLSQTDLRLSFRRHVTSGSGIFNGADSNVVRLTATRQLSRLWEAAADLGYSHNTRIQPSTEHSATRTFQSEYAGISARRRIRRDLTGFVRYQYTNSGFNDTFCDGPGCDFGRTAQRHVVTFGLDWYLRPIRLD